MLAPTSLAIAESPNGCPRIIVPDTPTDFVALLKAIYLPGYVTLPLRRVSPLTFSVGSFLEPNKVPDFDTFSSLLKITAKYEMSTIRSWLLEVIRGAYPDTLEGVTTTKPLGENVFSGATPHPNEVLSLLVQQKLTSALQMAYYMAARRGIDSLMDRGLPMSARLSREILQPMIRGLTALRELELNETHRLILGSKTSNPCFMRNCPIGGSDPHQSVIDRITGASQSGTRVLEIPSLSGICGCHPNGLGETCVRKWEAARAELRKKAWDMLPRVFGLEG